MKTCRTPLRFTATPQSATAAGVGLGVGASVFEKLNLVGPFWFALEAVVFFLVPFLVWVVGLDHFQKHWMDFGYQFSREYWTQRLPQELIRAICWFAGAGISGMACSYVLYWR